MRGGVAGDIDAGGIVAGADGGGERLHLAQSGNFPASGAPGRAGALKWLLHSQQQAPHARKAPRLTSISTKSNAPHRLLASGIQLFLLAGIECSKASLFDHFVGAREHRWQYSKAE
jgi:hypothetical protein